MQAFFYRGLRVLLKLRQMQKHLEITDVSPEVYDILEVTGFVELLDVKKKFREVSIENCELIGKGGIGSVYRISEDEITMETSFADDLGADSLDLFQIISELEESFEIEFANEDAEKIKTVGDAVEYIKNAANK